MSIEEAKGSIIEAFKTILSSPVGGWVLAVLVVCYVAWLTSQDRQAIYEDLNNLREQAMPSIISTPKLATENQMLLEEIKARINDISQTMNEIRTIVRMPNDNRQTIQEIRKMLMEQTHPTPEPTPQ